MSETGKSEKREIAFKNKVIPYELIRSKRKTYAISVEAGGILKVRVPQQYNKEFLDNMLEERKGWILEKYTISVEKAEKKKTSDIPEYKRRALEEKYRRDANIYVPIRVEFFAKQMGVTYHSVTIRGQKTRWGSCNSRGGLSFNWKLMLAPREILDYVVVHELCHRKEMNHSKVFWAEVEQVIPDYKEKRQWLKEHGDELEIG